MEKDPVKRQKRFDTIARALALLAIFLMMFSVGAGYYAASLPQPEAAPTETVQPSITPSPTPTRTPPPTARLTPGPREVYIPGLEADDLRHKFLANMYTCSEPVLGESGYYEWTCQQESSTSIAEVRVFSRSPDTVDRVIGTIRQMQNPFIGTAKRFLAMIAELRYENAEPRHALQWLDQALLKSLSPDQVERAVFGEVLFELSGTPLEWTLSLGELPESESGE